jgi:hypothetical protein
MDPRPEQYHAYILRLWLVEWNEKWIWRVSLENIHTGKRHGFANMEALVDFLQEMGKTSQPATRSDRPDH